MPDIEMNHVCGEQSPPLARGDGLPTVSPAVAERLASQQRQQQHREGGEQP